MAEGFTSFPPLLAILGGGGFHIFLSSPSPSWVYLLAHPISQPGVEHLKVLNSRAPKG
jgi:hypothetical protein